MSLAFKELSHNYHKPSTINQQTFSLCVSAQQSSTNAITNYHKLGGLKQREFTPLPFWSSEVQTQFPMASRRKQRRFPPKALKGQSVPLPFSASSTHLYSLASDPFLYLQSNITPVSVSVTHSSGSDSSCKHCCDFTGPSGIIQGTLPSQAPQLNYICKVPLPCMVTRTGFGS